MVKLRTGHFILSGEINSGKSTRLSQLALKLASDGVIVAGLISMPCFKDGEKCGFELHIINNSKIISVIEFASIAARSGWQKFRRWHFNPNAFANANSFKFDKADLFILDEIGPLEIEWHGGFFPLTRTIYLRYQTTITVIRKVFVDKYKEILKRSDVFVNELDEINNILL